MTDTQRLIRRQYRISSWRFDVQKSTDSTFFTEGETVEECDEKARKKFQEASDKPHNEWNGMDIVRIDTPAVAEKVTFLMKNGRQESND